jgi:hypothetical protein
MNIYRKLFKNKYRIQETMNGNCSTNNHEKCPAKSAGTSLDPINFVCICSCHKWAEKMLYRLFAIEKDK